MARARRLRGAIKRLGERLIADEMISEEQLRLALDKHQDTGKFLGETLIEMGYIRPKDLAIYVCESTGFPFVELADTEIDYTLARLVEESFARRNALVPFGGDGTSVFVAMVDPLDLGVIDSLRASLKKPVEPFLAFRADVESAINQVFDLKHTAGAVLREIDYVDRSADLSVDELVGMAEDAPIVRVVNSVIQGAIHQDASDVHIEPQERAVKVRYRLDGLLADQMTIPKHHHAACVSRVKIMSHLNIAERRRPQDGRFTIKDPGGKVFDVRVSVMPTVFGEKVVMRLLEKTSTHTSLDSLGFFPEQKQAFESLIRRPYGIVLVTGPTGSGKSTTLHAALQLIGSSSININTIEDPVEYNLPGANQVQVNAKIGITFASALRTFLRQDPDVIMVGEIRDPETAEIAIQAALTGHLVLSTVHTNDAPGALVRLQNMGVEPFLVSSAVLGTVGQRLLRTVCSGCKKMVDPDPAAVEQLGLDPEKKGIKVAQGMGCAKCNGRGLKGRTAAFEVMPMSETLRGAVLARESTDTLKDIARSEGMRTIQECGIEMVLNGTTTPAEVMRVLFIDE